MECASIPRFWSELHRVATNYYTTVLLADSTSHLVETLIEGDLH